MNIHNSWGMNVHDPLWKFCVDLDSLKEAVHLHFSAATAQVPWRCHRDVTLSLLPGRSCRWPVHTVDQSTAWIELHLKILPMSSVKTCLLFYQDVLSFSCFSCPSHCWSIFRKRRNAVGHIGSPYHPCPKCLCQIGVKDPALWHVFQRLRSGTTRHMFLPLATEAFSTSG